MKGILSALQVLRDPVALLLCFFCTFPAYGAWLTILVYQDGMAFTEVLWAKSLALFIVAAVFALTCWKPLSRSRIVSSLLLFVPVGAIAGIVLLPEVNALYVALYLITVAALTVMVAANYAMALPHIQSGDNRDLNLAVIMTALPTVGALSYAGLAYLAEIHVNLVHIVMCGVLLFMACVAAFRKRPFEVLPPPVKLKAKIQSRAILVMAVNLIYAGPYYILKGVLIPLYLYEKLNGNFGLVGLVLSFLCFIAIFSRIAKRKANEAHIPTRGLVIGSLLAMACAFGVWALTDSIWVATGMLALHTLAHRLYAFGLLSELQKSDVPNYTEHAKLKEAYQHVVGALGFGLSAYFASALMDSYEMLLIAFAIITVLAAMVFYIGTRKPA